MKKLCLNFVVGLLVVFTSCGSDGVKLEDNLSIKAIDNQLDFAITEKYQTLDPIKIGDFNSFRIANQVYESLLQFDNNDLTLKPSLADSWSVSEDGLVYTFKLKKGVFFHDNACFEGGKGREIKSSDVVYSFKRICSNEPSNYAYAFFQEKIVGAEDFYSSSLEIDRKELKGVKAIDDYTVVITLQNPSSTFIESNGIIYGAIVAREAIEKNQIIGSGPFIYSKEGDTEEGITLQRNPNYHISNSKGVRLPYIDAVSYKYYNQSQKELDAFMRGELDVITEVPAESIKELMEDQIADFQNNPAKYFLERNQKIATTFLNLNTAVAPLNDVKVRQAIAHAIDKQRLVDVILKGEAYGPADYGIVPPVIKNYDYTSVVGLEHNVNKAKRLLAEAGYKNGEDFPTLSFLSGKTNIAIRLGLDIQKQLAANLNIHVEISSLSLVDRMEENKYGKGHITTSTWLAEYPDPLSFLLLTYGGNVPESLNEPSLPNGSRYVNPEFDALFDKASRTLDKQKKYELCLIADQIIANDVPIIPLWYRENYGLIQSSVKNYKSNALVGHSLTHVKIVEQTKKKKKDL